MLQQGPEVLPFIRKIKSSPKGQHILVFCKYGGTQNAQYVETLPAILPADQKYF
jgi:hypothetical protein